ncbi:MAG: hypothetical protein M1822_001124 [Bathelium mastoideum]|nr:MAG: hypothetical protein M1822_001124 [Bathelium mastoideum]
MASHSQYELQFNKWGDRKNLTVNEWRLILQTLDQYSENGKKCAVYLNKQLVHPSVLKRKRRECRRGQTRTRPNQQRASTALLPDCVEVRIIPLDDGSFESSNVNELEGVFDLGPSDQAVPMDELMPDVTGSYGSETGVLVGDDLHLGFQDPADALQLLERDLSTGDSAPPVSHDQDNSSTFVDLNSDFLSTAVAGADPIIPMNEQYLPPNHPFGLFRAFPSPPSQLFGTAYIRAQAINGDLPSVRPNHPPELLYDLNLINGLTAEIPSFSFEQHQSHPTILAQNALPDMDRQFDPMTPDHTELPAYNPDGQFIPRTQSLITPRSSSTSIDMLSRMGNLESSLSSLLPPEAMSPDTGSNSRTALQNKIFGLPFHRLLIASIENNFAGLEGVPIGDILTFLEHDPQMRDRLLAYLSAGSENVSRAIAEKLVRAAIESCNGALVKFLMSTEYVSMDDVVCTVRQQRYTALERSAMLRNVEVTKILLEAGTNVNKSYSIRAGRGILQLAIGHIMFSKDYKPVDIRLISMLLEYDAKVDESTLWLAVRYQDAALVRALMAKFPASEHSTVFTQRRIMQHILEKLDKDLATSVMMQIIQDCPGTKSCMCRRIHHVLARSVMTAAMRGYLELVAFLLDHTDDKDRALVAAVRGGQKHVVDFLLKKGANVDAVAWCFRLPYQNHCRATANTTPLAEAIRAGNKELVLRFESHGARTRINEKKEHFAAALEAASDVGDLAYLEVLLQEATEIDGRYLYQALLVSAMNGHEQIAFTLLRAGAHVKGFSEQRSDASERDFEHLLEGMESLDGSDSPLLASVRQRNKNLTYIMMECDVSYALAGYFSKDAEEIATAAIEWGDTSIIKDLSSLSRVMMTALQNVSVTQAIMAGNKSLVDFLVKELGANMNNGPTMRNTGMRLPPLELAVSNQDLPMVQHLLELGADPCCDGAIDKAIFGDRRILVLLLDTFRTKYPEGIKGFGCDALVSALWNNKTELVDTFLEAKIDVNTFYTPETALGAAISRNRRCGLALIRQLLSAGGDPNSVVFTGDDDGTTNAIESPRTALLQAIRTKNVALVSLLVDSGADIHRPARFFIKRTPLQCACEVGCMEIVDLLLAKGARIEEAPAVSGGGTSLQLCAMRGYAGIAYKLLQHGADVHAAPSEINGRTALEGAAENGRLDMIKVLWDAAGSNRFTAKQCHRAMKLAERNGHMVCHDLLMQLRLSCQDFLTSTPFVDEDVA